MESRYARGRSRGICAFALVVLALSIFAVIPGTAGASVPGTALIDEESVTTFDGIEKGGQPISLEQYAAEKAGFAVTVKSGPEWEAMSEEEFGQYQVLVVGDPECDETALSAVESAKTWTKVVMGSVSGHEGNRALVGTDPEYHYIEGEGGAPPTDPSNPQTAGAEHLVQDGIAYAGGVAGATGVYFDTSCTDLEEEPFVRGDARPASNPQEVLEGPDGRDITDVLDHLTLTGPGHWVEDVDPPCGGEVSLIAATAAFQTAPTALRNTDIQGWECSTHIAFAGYPSDWFALAIDLETSSHPTCGRNIETSEFECGEAYVLVAGADVSAEAPNLSLSPPMHSSSAGPKHEHTVTANAHEEGQPIAGSVVSFTLAGTNAGVPGVCTTGKGEFDPECKTDENGDVRFTYSDANGAGNDTIIGSITLENEGVDDAHPAALKTTERATAAQEWVSRLTLTPPTGSSEAGASHQHTVTAKVADEGTPIPEVAVSFTLSGTNAGVAGTCTTGGGAADPGCVTDEHGEVRFTYNDVHGAGQDTIGASVGIEEEEETPTVRPALVKVTTEHASATQAWVLPPPPPGTQPATAKAAVLAVTSAKPAAGKASVASVRGCVASASYLASVRGSSMQTVKFVLDGHTVKTVKVASGASKASARLSVHPGGKHHLTIKVTFTKASGTAAKTFHRTLARCAAHVVQPRFTG
jgi:hypothetical protein